MQTTNDRMTEKQVSDLLHLATELQAKAESSNDRDTAVMAYAVQKVCLELTESRLKSKASEQQLAAVVAECAGLKAAFSPKEIPSEAFDAFQDTVTIDHDWDDSGSWSYVDNETEVISAVLDALKTETPATDAYLVEVRAKVAEEALKIMGNFTSDECGDSVYIAIKEFAAQLRQGAAL